jgi:SAM-dependent methyltransferase
VLRERVHEAYSAASRKPEGSNPFPIGLEFAREAGYPADLLTTLPDPSIEAFTGISAVSVFAEIEAGDVVLDLGCGAGLDAIVAAHKAGPAGRVLGIDFSEAMLARAAQSGRQSHGGNLVFVQADAERLPLREASVDAAIVNGIFNLNPWRDSIFSELARVLKCGARVFGAELVLQAPLASEQRFNTANWFS